MVMKKIEIILQKNDFHDFIQDIGVERKIRNFLKQNIKTNIVGAGYKIGDIETKKNILADNYKITVTVENISQE